MKKLKVVLVLYFVLMVHSGVQAQEEIHQKIANETCECISKRNVDLSKKKEAEMALGLCLIESATANKLEMDLANKNAMRELGSKIGVLMLPICPDVFMALADKEDVADEEVVVESVSGVIKSVDVGDFYYLVVKEPSGKEHKFIWLQYFPGSDDFVKDPKTLKGKRVTVYYQTWEVFSPVSKSYYNHKEITDLVIE